MTELEEAYFWTQADLTKAIDGLRDMAHMIKSGDITKTIADIESVLLEQLSAVANMQDVILHETAK